jgi:hypothetical protein
MCKCGEKRPLCKSLRARANTSTPAQTGDRRSTRHNTQKGQQSSGEYEQRLDLSRYASGVYFLELRVHDGSDLKFRKVQKLVLVR